MTLEGKVRLTATLLGALDGKDRIPAASTVLVQ
jgi:hypothetical protein